MASSLQGLLGAAPPAGGGARCTILRRAPRSIIEAAVPARHRANLPAELNPLGLVGLRPRRAARVRVRAGSSGDDGACVRQPEILFTFDDEGGAGAGEGVAAGGVVGRGGGGGGAAQVGWVEHASGLVELALPVVAVEVGMVTMNVVDAAMVGHVSEVALGGVALGHTYSWLFMCFGAGTLTVLDPVISQAVGAGDEPAARLGVQRGVLLALALAVPVMLAMCTAGPVLALLGQPAELLPLAGEYSTVCTLSVVPFLLFTLFRQTLQATDTVRPLVVASAIANVSNIGLNYLFIHGAPALGLGGMGAIGSAWATVACRFMLLGLVMWAARAPLGRTLRPWAGAELRNVRPLATMAGLGFTLGLQQLVEWGAFTCTALLMGRLGATEVAGYQIANSLTDVTYMVPLGISAAASVRVGQAVGRGDLRAATTITSLAIATGAAVTGTFGLVFATFPEAIARLWSSTPGVVAMAATIIPVAGCFQVFDGLRVMSVAVLRGVGQTRAAFAANVLGFWLVGLPLSVQLAFNMGWGAAGLWMGMAGGLAVAAVLCTMRIYYLLANDRVKRLELDLE